METKEYFEKEMFFESLRLPLDKISCTRQFESKLSLRSFAKSLAKGSSTSNQAFSIVFTTPSVPLIGDRNLRRKDVTALLGARNRYAIRLAGHQSPRQVLRDGTARLLLADEERLANVRVST